VLEYDKIRLTSISSEEFEYLFNRGKIGSRMLDYAQLSGVYQSLHITDPADHMTIHAQEFLDSPQDEEFPWFLESP